jgi:hypothetical protein
MSQLLAKPKGAETARDVIDDMVCAPHVSTGDPEPQRRSTITSIVDGT